MNFPAGSYGSTDTEGYSQRPDFAMGLSRKSLFENTSPMGPEPGEEGAPSWDSITGELPLSLQYTNRLLSQVGMASTLDGGETTATIHVATVFSHAQSIRIPTTPIDGDAENGIGDARRTPHWYSQIAEFRDRFDLDYDLGGNAIARVWGLDTHRGWISACFTLHPSDMVEYTTATEERVIVIFSPAEEPGPADQEVALPWAVPTLDSDRVKDSYRKVLQFTLNLDYTKYFQNIWEQKILYAAACCAAVTSLDNELLSLSKHAFIYLAHESGADLTEEILKCDTSSSAAGGESSGSMISSKTRSQLQGTGSQLFETCEICGNGIEWYSGEESQCSEGHQFG